MIKRLLPSLFILLAGLLLLACPAPDDDDAITPPADWTNHFVIAAGQTLSYPFEAKNDGIAIVSFPYETTGADWGSPGRESILLRLTLDRRYVSDIIAPGASAPLKTSSILGQVDRGQHNLRLTYNKGDSPAQKGLIGMPRNEFIIEVIAETDPRYTALRYAPIIYGRDFYETRDDVTFSYSDAPMMVVYNNYSDPDGEVYQYSLISTNIDAGSGLYPRSLMARTGSMAYFQPMIEIKLGADKQLFYTRIFRDGIFEGFNGSRLDDHPILKISSAANDLSDSFVLDPAGEIRFFLAPTTSDIGSVSFPAYVERTNPAINRLTYLELVREGKIKKTETGDPPVGLGSGEQIADPRNYIYVEMLTFGSSLQNSLAVESIMESTAIYQSDFSEELDDPSYRIGESGMVRAAVELPHGKSPLSVDILRLIYRPLSPLSSTTWRIFEVRAFTLDDNLLPYPAFLEWTGEKTIDVNNPTFDFKLDLTLDDFPY